MRAGSEPLATRRVLRTLVAEATGRIDGQFTRCREQARMEVLRIATRLRFEPDDVSAWHGLGVALATLGDRTGALVALRSALLRDAGHAPSHLALGKLLFDCGQVEHALHCFDCANRHPSA